MLSGRLADCRGPSRGAVALADAAKMLMHVRWVR